VSTPGWLYSTVVNWLGVKAAQDSLETNHNGVSAVVECLQDAGVPAGWLRLFAYKSLDELVVGAWSDGWLRAGREELVETTRLLARLDWFTSNQVPWGAAAWHVLLGVLQDRYGDGMVVWVPYRDEE
jgi:hypothetical protein